VESVSIFHYIYLARDRAVPDLARRLNNIQTTRRLNIKTMKSSQII
jgi:hypothetical protein